jgi:hypothetical protein
MIYIIVFVNYNKILKLKRKINLKQEKGSNRDKSRNQGNGKTDSQFEQNLKENLVL